MLMLSGTPSGSPVAETDSIPLGSGAFAFGMLGAGGANGDVASLPVHAANAAALTSVQSTHRPGAKYMRAMLNARYGGTGFMSLGSGLLPDEHRLPWDTQ